MPSATYSATATATVLELGDSERRKPRSAFSLLRTRRSTVGAPVSLLGVSGLPPPFSVRQTGSSSSSSSRWWILLLRLREVSSVPREILKELCTSPSLSGCIYTYLVCLM